MGMTIAEKILARAAGVEKVSPGEIITTGLDWCMSNDGTTHINIDLFNTQLKNKKLAKPESLVFIVDHNLPADSEKTAAVHKKMRDFARENGIKYHEGDGVCHQIMLEQYIKPGDLAIAADSHTCSYGALGAFGTGVGSTDLVYSMATGTTWLLVPETIRFELTGSFPEGVYARDLILQIIGTIGANGANYKVMEFAGEAVARLTVDDRIVLCNMAVEAGAKCGIVEPDDIVRDYMRARGVADEDCRYYSSDPDAQYLETHHFDLSELTPVVARPHNVDNVVPVDRCRGVSIDQGFIGSCNNGRIEELREAAKILRGNKVKAGVRLLVVPASQAVYLQALEEGLMQIFSESGAIIMNPNCSVCWGSCQGVMGEGERLISTGTRNFKGRSGHASSEVYLASAATVAASVIAGEIVDPRG